MIGIMEAKVCTKCNVEYPDALEYFYVTSKGALGTHCKKCRKEYARQYRLRNIKRVQEWNRQYRKQHREKLLEYDREHYRQNRKERRNSKLENEFGITLNQYNQMLKEQNSVCAICGSPEIVIDRRIGKPRTLSVDHNHNTNKVRGLLCQKCNTMLGLADVDNQGTELLCSAISYIKNGDNI